MTAQAESAAIAWEELRALGAANAVWLDEETVLCELPCDFATFSHRVIDHRAVFVRHICPVDAVIALQNDGYDLKKIAQGCKNIRAALDSARSFSVQTRTVGGAVLKPFDVNARLSEGLAHLDVRVPQQVISVVLTPDCVYVGLSDTPCNLSGWAGGKRRFAVDDTMISRAEFKLLEAMEVFGLDWPRGHALDLGAAPGGWTRILLAHGLKVTAVDPALLDERLINAEGLNHYRETAQRFFAHADMYDMIVNDMKLDVHESVAIMNDAAAHLKQNGVGLMTLKLAHKGQRKAVRSALEVLETQYEIVGARQLFHNRSEVTVAMRKRDV